MCTLFELLKLQTTNGLATDTPNGPYFLVNPSINLVVSKVCKFCVVRFFADDIPNGGVGQHASIVLEQLPLYCMCVGILALC